MENNPGKISTWTQEHSNSINKVLCSVTKEAKSTGRNKSHHSPLMLMYIGSPI